MTHKDIPVFPKKIDRSVLYTQASLSFSSEDVGKGDKAYIVEPLFALPTLAQARRRVVADCLARAHQLPLISAINPTMMGFAGVPHAMMWEARNRLYNEIDECLHRLGIHLHSSDMLAADTLQTIHEVAEKLVDKHRVSCRDDVSFFNIAQKTVVPDHRVAQEKRQGTRYHIRLFVEAKKYSVVASLDEPCFLFACVAILVNPLDKRYKKLIGKDVIVPLINKPIPLRAHESVSMEGNGTMMLIPAHRREDYNIALEMNLPTDVYAVDQYGCFTSHAKDFAGKSMLTFRDNIIQFLDDISNIDLKEYVTITHFVDSQTGDILLPLLQKNIFISLYADILHALLSDETIALKACPDTLSTSLAPQDSRWCISGRDTRQSQVLYSIDTQHDLQPLHFPQTMPLLTCIVADAVMLGICPSFFHPDQLIEGLLVSFHSRPLIDYLLSYYQVYHPDLYARDKGDKLRQLFFGLASDDEKLAKHSDDLLHRLETSDGIICTDQGYHIVDLPTHAYSYDHEYMGLLSLMTSVTHLQKPRHLLYFFGMQESYWLTHSLLLSSYIADRRKDKIIPHSQTSSLICIDATDEIMDVYYMKQVDIYGGDIVRLSMILTASLTDEEKSPVYSLDMLHRFIHKRWNASRLLTMTAREAEISYSSSHMTVILSKHSGQLTDYDIWIITNLQRIVRDVVYYRDKYAVATSAHLCIQSLRYDIAEITLTILKHYASPLTPVLSALAVEVCCILFEPYAPHSSSSLLFFIQSDEKKRSSLLDSVIGLEYNKNYKLTLMMDVIRQWHVLLSQIASNTSSLTLIVQANKDFSDYLMSQEEFVLRCFPQASIRYVHENDTLADNLSQSRIMDITLALEIHHKEPEPVVSLSVLTGQHAYKKQLIQTLRNTIMRLRQSPGKDSADQVASLEKQVVDLQKELEKLEYDIAKMKYYKN